MLIGWNSLQLRLSHIVCLSFTAKTAHEHQFFLVRTLNGQLEEREENFAESDRKLMGYNIVGHIVGDVVL